MIEASIIRWARVQPDRTAYVHDDRPFSYADFARAIEAARAYLSSVNLPTAGLAIVDIDDFAINRFVRSALHLLGLDTITLPPGVLGTDPWFARAACLVTRQADVGAAITADPTGNTRVVGVPDAVFAGIGGGPLPPVPETGAPGHDILLTSGTTGTHKKLRRTNAESCFTTLAKLRGYDRNTVFHGTNRGFWTGAGTAMPYTIWAAGGCVVTEQRGDPLRSLFRHPITEVFLLPDEVRRLPELPEAMEHQRPDVEIVTGGGLVSLTAATAVVSRLRCKLSVVYSSTECPQVLRSRFATPDDLIWLAPDSPRRVEVVDENGMERAVGEEGELRIAPMDGDARSYIDDPAATARMFRGDWFHPGDLAVRRADGRIRILGRASDVIVVGGQKIASGPIEQSLQQSLRVHAVCVFTGLSAAGEDEMVIAIESDRELPATELDALARGFPPFERARIELMAQFPRTTTGTKKIQRQTLRRRLFPDPTT